MSSGSVHDLSPLFVAVYVFPATVTSMVAAVSSTVPVSWGVVSPVVNGSTVTTGGVVSNTMPASVA